MKTQTYVFSSVAAINECLAFLKENWKFALSIKKPLIIKVTDKREEYTAAQRRLYWMWVHQFAKHFGNDDNEVHRDIKARFLIKIYMRDDAEFAKTCHVVGALQKSEPDYYQVIKNHVINSVSITDASKVQMSEFMDKFYHFAQKHGCHLITPDDLKFATESQ